MFTNFWFESVNNIFYSKLYIHIRLTIILKYNNNYIFRYVRKYNYLLENVAIIFLGT